MTEESSFKRYFLSSALNTILFLKILIFSLLKSSQVLGKLTNGCFDRVDNLTKGTYSKVSYYYKEYDDAFLLLFSLHWSARCY